MKRRAWRRTSPRCRQYGGEDVEYTGFAGPQFGNVLTLAKFLNAIGPDSVTGDAIKAQVDAFTGPMMMTAGPMTCGEVSPIFPSLCGAEMGIQQYVGGEWVSVADALNGKPINPGAALEPRPPEDPARHGTRGEVWPWHARRLFVASPPARRSAR